MVNTPYEVRIAPAAKEQLLQLSSKQQKQILNLCTTLRINPRPAGAKRLEGMTGLYVEMMQQVRIIYKIDEQEILILLIKN
jgi:mRNA interferase RelE/StbE